VPEGRPVVEEEEEATDESDSKATVGPNGHMAAVRRISQ
jgi:hypothetical protein